MFWKPRLGFQEGRTKSELWDGREISIDKNSGKAFGFSKRGVSNLCVWLLWARTPLTKRNGCLRTVTPSIKHPLETVGSRISTVMNHSMSDLLKNSPSLLFHYHRPSPYFFHLDCVPAWPGACRCCYWFTNRGHNQLNFLLSQHMSYDEN